jgi:hypothetical protein
VAPIEVVDGRPLLAEFGNVGGGLRSPHVSRVIRSIARRVAQRVITGPDGRHLIRDASRVGVPSNDNVERCLTLSYFGHYGRTRRLM